MEKNNLKIYDLLRKLEIALCDGFRLLHCYVIVNRYIPELINDIKEALPIEIQKTKAQLIKSGCGNIFKYLDHMEELVHKSKDIFGFKILNEKELLIYIDKIYLELPETAKTAKDFLNS